jgi:hypothetical protein
MSMSSAPLPLALRPAPVRRSRLVFAALAAVTLAVPLPGCGSMTTGGSGDEGTVDLSAAKDAAEKNTNPEIADAVKRRGGGLGAAPNKVKGR